MALRAVAGPRAAGRRAGVGPRALAQHGARRACRHDDRRDGRRVRAPRARRAAHRRAHGAAARHRAGPLRRRARLVRGGRGRRPLGRHRVGQLAGHRAPGGATPGRWRAGGHRQHDHRPDRAAARTRRGARAHRRRAPGQRRARVPGRGAHPAVRADAAARVSRAAVQCDERVLRQHGGRLSPDRRARRDARPAPGGRWRCQGCGRHAPSPGAHDRHGRRRCERARMARRRARLARPPDGGDRRAARTRGESSGGPVARPAGQRGLRHVPRAGTGRTRRPALPQLRLRRGPAGAGRGEPRRALRAGVRAERGGGGAVRRGEDEPPPKRPSAASPSRGRHRRTGRAGSAVSAW